MKTALVILALVLGCQNDNIITRASVYEKPEPVSPGSLLCTAYADGKNFMGPCAEVQHKINAQHKVLEQDCAERDIEEGKAERLLEIATINYIRKRQECIKSSGDCSVSDERNMVSKLKRELYSAQNSFSSRGCFR